MSTENNKLMIREIRLSSEQTNDIMKLAAVGFMPREIAAAIELPRELVSLFCDLANLPGSEINSLIVAGRANGRSQPQIKLQEAAAAGNLDAIKQLQMLQANNRFNEFVNYMDDDEFTP